ncbi:Na(+)/H(+) antiporter subunit B [Priestia koreensis]|uniref:Cation:proton antiporter n=1 Tax=Priestia koreensis TaxID=284581 RepID=A0A0M0LBU3_9BACI|nr:Na(+)/H(+) antiporter subunit B [Priestia koreensis]KOO48529.1 cation:proton antiporter [Priestia koreensis]
MKSNDIILQTAAKFVTFIIMIFSFYIFLGGHFGPGGGFVGGLLTSSALVLMLLAFDIKTMSTVIPFDYKLLIPIGLLVALGTGVGSFFFHVPFLTHAFGHFTLPIIGETELATATIFDLGVYLVVVGITMTIIQTIGESE